MATKELFVRSGTQTPVAKLVGFDTFVPETQGPGPGPPGGPVGVGQPDTPDPHISNSSMLFQVLTLLPRPVKRMYLALTLPGGFVGVGIGGEGSGGGLGGSVGGGGGGGGGAGSGVVCVFTR